MQETKRNSKLIAKKKKKLGKIIWISITSVVEKQNIV